MQIEMIILHEFLFSFQSCSPLIQGQMYTGIVFLYHRDRDKFHLCMDQQQMSIPDLQAEQSCCHLCLSSIQSFHQLAWLKCGFNYMFVASYSCKMEIQQWYHQVWLYICKRTAGACV